MESSFGTHSITLNSNQFYVGTTVSIQEEISKFSSVKWFRGNCLEEYDDDPVSTGSSYTIQSEDLEKFIKIQITDDFGGHIEKKIFISSLPVVYIDTRNGSEILSYGDTLADINIQGNSEFPSQYTGKVEIHLRGDSSYDYPTQKPYKIKLKKKTNLFGFGANRHWVLVSNFIDNSLLRNKIATELAEYCGIKYAKMTHVVLVLNGVCQGVYMLAEHVRINENRVDIFNWEDESESRGYQQDTLQWVDSDDSLDISGGYLYELDEGYDETSQFKTNLGTKVMIRKPEFAYTSEKMMDFSRKTWKDIQDSYNTIGYLSGDANFLDLIDIDSFSKFIAIGMIMENIDMANRSVFCYKDIDEKLKFGPIWDFDLAANSIVWGETYPYNVWGIIRDTPQCFYNSMLSHPYVSNEVLKSYKSLKTKLSEIIQNMDSRISSLSSIGEMNDTARRTNEYTPSWGSGTTYTLRGFSDDSSNLKTFLQNRMTWLDTQFKTLDSFMRSWGNDYQKNPYTIRYSYIHFIVNGEDKSFSNDPNFKYTTNDQYIYFTFKYIDSNQWNLKILVDGVQKVYLENQLTQTIVSIPYTSEMKQEDDLVIEAIVEKSVIGSSESTYSAVPRSYIVLSSTNDPIPLSECTFAGLVSELSYDKNPRGNVPSYFLHNGKTYSYTQSGITITYSPDETSYGDKTVTISGSGIFTGTVTHEFTWKAPDISDTSKCTISGINSKYEYTGSAITPTVKVVFDGTTLTLNTDYTVEYSDNTEIGNATVTIQGIGNYTGTVVKTFEITAPVVFTGTTFLLDVNDNTAKTFGIYSATIKSGTSSYTMDWGD